MEIGRDVAKRVLRDAKANLVRMLNDRLVAGVDAEVDLEELPGAIWAIQRDRTLVAIMPELNKSAVTTAVRYCDPVALVDPGDEVEGHSEKRADHAILVHRGKHTSSGIKELTAHPTLTMEHFPIGDVAKCPLDYGFQDEHRLLSVEEGEAVLARCGTQVDEMAFITTEDAVQRWYNAPLGRVFEVTERWGTSIQPNIKYRVVTKPST